MANGKAGAPFGNKNGARAKVWRDAINRALAKATPANIARVDELAETLVSLAAQGDMAALKEIGDRLDGKPAQSMQVSGEDGGPVQLQRIERVIVDPKHSDS